MEGTCLSTRAPPRQRVGTYMAEGSLPSTRGHILLYQAMRSAQTSAIPLPCLTHPCHLQSCTPRWQTCISNTDDTLGFALGSLFVKATFDRDSKAIVSTQSHHISDFSPHQFFCNTPGVKSPAG